MLCRILSINFWEKNVSEDIIWKINKNILSHLADFGHKGWGRGVGGRGLGGEGESVEKENLGQNFFSDNSRNSRKL